MRSFKFSSIFAVMLALFVAVAGVDVLAQGKGKGRSGDKQRGGQRAERGGQDRGDRGRNRSVVAPHASRGQANPGRQGRERGNDRRAQDRPQRQEQRAIRQGRGNEQRVQTQQQQRQIRQAQRRGDDERRRRGNEQRVQVQQQQRQIWQAQRRGDDERRGRGNERRVQVQQQQRQIWQAQRRGDDERRGRGNERRIRGQQNAGQPQIIPRQKWRDRQSRSIFVQRQAAPPFSGNWPSNYGQQRRAEVHQRNAERKALRDFQRRERNLAGRWDRDRWSDDRRRDVGRRWDNSRRFPSVRTWSYSAPTVFWQQAYTPVYRTPTYRTRTFYDVYPQTYGTAYGYNNGYPGEYYDYNDRPSGADILRNVIFAVLGGGGMPAYDNYYPQGGTYQPNNYGAYSPQYAGYNSSPYYPASYGDNYGDPYYDPYQYDDPYYAEEALPVQYFVSNGPGSNLFRDIFGQLLAIGYDQGYRDGLSARDLRERDRTFYDPYAYDNDVHDPYSVSLGYNRRSLSQGYELGYEDALDNVGSYDQFQHGDIDLVSVLIGAVSQLM